MSLANTYRKFFNLENTGITRTQFRDFGIGKIGRDPVIRDPGLQSLITLQLVWLVAPRWSLKLLLRPP